MVNRACCFCGKQCKDLKELFEHIDEKHPEVASKIKQNWKKEGLI
jgi:hypothetical protein